MKTSFSAIILLTGVLATAGAFGLEPLPTTRYRKVAGDPTTCTPIRVNCNNLPCEQCQVLTPYGIRSVYSGTRCAIPVTHFGGVLIPE